LPFHITTCIHEQFLFPLHMRGKGKENQDPSSFSSSLNKEYDKIKLKKDIRDGGFSGYTLKFCN